MNDKKSFWITLPGILSGAAAIITATTGIIIALNSAGFFENEKEKNNIISEENKFKGEVVELGTVPPSSNNANKEQKTHLQITGLQLLDEKYTEQNEKTYTLKELIPRSSHDFFYKEPNDLIIALLFTVEGYKSYGALQIDIDCTFCIQDSNGHELAKGTLPRFTKISDWRLMSNAKNIGVGKVTKYLSLPLKDNPNTPIPYIVIIEKFKEKEIPNKFGDIIFSITDKLTNQIVEDRLRIQVFQERGMGLHLY